MSVEAVMRYGATAGILIIPRRRVTVRRLTIHPRAIVRLLRATVHPVIPLPALVLRPFHRQVDVLRQALDRRA